MNTAAAALRAASAIEDLGSADPGKRKRGTRHLLSVREPSGIRPGNVIDEIHALLTDGWHALGPQGAELVGGLVEAFLTERGLFETEIIGHALAAQGEDGATELVELLNCNDFTIRHMAVAGLSGLRDSGRWAVPSLLRRMRTEPQSMVQCTILYALGRIGGAQAVEALESFRFSVLGRDAAVAGIIELALANALNGSE